MSAEERTTPGEKSIADYTVVEESTLIDSLEKITDELDQADLSEERVAEIDQQLGRIRATLNRIHKPVTINSAREPTTVTVRADSEVQSAGGSK